MTSLQIQNQTVDMGAQAAGLARTQTRGTQSLIRMNDRDITKIEAKANQEASLLGSLAFYAWGNGKDRIEGPSWELAKALIRIYGNCSLDMEPIQDMADSWVMTARVVDHETGYSISRQFRQSKKWVVYGKFDDARKDDIRFQIGQSKSLRNVVLSFLPGWLVDRAIDTAKGGVREKIEKSIKDHGMDKVVDRCVDRCGRIGVDEKRMLDAMGRKTRQALTVEDLVILQGGISAVETGQDTVDSVFPVLTVEATEAPIGSKAEQITAKIRESRNGTGAEAEGRETPAAPPTGQPSSHSEQNAPKPEPVKQEPKTAPAQAPANTGTVDRTAPAGRRGRATTPAPAQDDPDSLEFGDPEGGAR